MISPGVHTNEDEISIALLIREYVMETGRSRLLLRDIRRYVRAKGYVHFIEWKFYDALKEMYDAGWVLEIDYTGNYVVFDKSLTGDNAV